MPHAMLLSQLAFHHASEPYSLTALPPSTCSHTSLGALSLNANPSGLLQAAWFKKHRLQRPAVAVLLLAKREVEGDAEDWARVSAQVHVQTSNHSLILMTIRSVMLFVSLADPSALSTAVNPARNAVQMWRHRSELRPELEGSTARHEIAWDGAQLAVHGLDCLRGVLTGRALEGGLIPPDLIQPQEQA